MKVSALFRSFVAWAHLRYTQRREKEIGISEKLSYICFWNDNSRVKQCMYFQLLNSTEYVPQHFCVPGQFISVVHLWGPTFLQTILRRPGGLGHIPGFASDSITKHSFTKYRSYSLAWYYYKIEDTFASPMVRWGGLSIRTWPEWFSHHTTTKKWEPPWVFFPLRNFNDCVIKKLSKWFGNKRPNWNTRFARIFLRSDCEKRP